MAWKVIWFALTFNQASVFSKDALKGYREAGMHAEGSLQPLQTSTADMHRNQEKRKLA